MTQTKEAELIVPRAVGYVEPPVPLEPPRRRRITMHSVHKWGGLISAAWLAVLGVTGFLLDHRDWRWIWQTPAPQILIPDRILEKERAAGFMVYRVNADDPRYRIAAGKRGLFTDRGKGWEKASFEGLNGAPQVFDVMMDARLGWNRLYAATDDGIWISKNGGEWFTPYALAGDFINAIAPGSSDAEIVVAAGRSSLYILNTDTFAIWNMRLSPAGPSVAARKIGLSRFVRDLHYGRGIVSGFGSVLINDVGGVLVLALCVTGFAFWLAPRVWRGKEKSARHESRMVHRRTMKALHRSHGLYMGLIAIIPVVYLSLTGIVIDHSDSLMKMMKKIQVDKKYLPPVYDLNSWDGEIFSVMGYPGQPEKISIGARSGLYTSTDRGGSWALEKLPGVSSCFAWSLSRLENGVFLGGMGCPNYYRENNGEWAAVKGSGHMATSAGILADGKLGLLSHGALKSGDIGGVFTTSSIDFPEFDNPPLFTLIEGLHSGLLIHPQWIWVNDAVSVVAIILCFTGLVRIVRARRVIARDFS